MNSPSPLPFCVIFDIDGTIFNAGHRMHLLPDNHESLPFEHPAWVRFLDAAKDDEPHPEIVILNQVLAKEFPIFIHTGRREGQRAMTEMSLRQHGLIWTKLAMRAQGDTRLDHVVKEEMLRLTMKTHKPLFSVEDRLSNARMYRANGIRCLHVADGDY